MKNLMIVCVLIAGLAFSGCTSSMQAGSRLEDLSDEEIAAYNNDPNNTDKIVCVEEKSIGSRISKRVCRKESSIVDRRQHDQQALDRIQSSPITNGLGGD